MAAFSLINTLVESAKSLEARCELRNQFINRRVLELIEVRALS
jgi:hypothetical protein